MLCRNIEEVHREKKLDPKTSGKRSQQYSNVDAGGYHTGKIWLRAHNGDFLAYYLYLIRNVTIHYTQPGSTIIDTPTFCFFIACYITWLNNPYKLIKLADLDPKLSTNNIRRIIANIKYIIDNPNYYHDFKRPVQELFQSFQAL